MDEESETDAGGSMDVAAELTVSTGKAAKPKPNIGKRHSCWQYVDQDSSKCKLHKHTYKGANTSNVMKHLQHNHQDRHKEVKKLEAEKRPKSSAGGTKIKLTFGVGGQVTARHNSYPKDSQRAKKLNGAYCALAATPAISHLMLTSPKFLDFVELLDPRYNCPKSRAKVVVTRF